MLALWRQNKRVKVRGKWLRSITILNDYDTSLTFTKLACNSPQIDRLLLKKGVLLTQNALCSHQSVLNSEQNQFCWQRLWVRRDI